MRVPPPGRALSALGPVVTRSISGELWAHALSRSRGLVAALCPTDQLGDLGREQRLSATPHPLSCLCPRFLQQ